MIFGEKMCARCGAVVLYVWGEGECEACHRVGIEETRQLRELYRIQDKANELANRKEQP